MTEIAFSAKTKTPAKTASATGFYTAGIAAAASGKLPPPANAAAAAGNSPLQVPQAAMVVGEPIPVIWGRRRGTVGGVLMFPKATEARFENTSTTVTSRYHMVIGEGRLPDIQRRDVRLGECRIGTFSQNYNQRAGSWPPGNFATAQSGYTVPTFPNYTGGGGNYQGLSTFEAGASFTGGSDDWRTAWNVFIRGGTIVERGRLLDSTVDSSDNIADLVLWALQRSGRVPDALIDLPSLTAAARFVEVNGFWCNGEFSASTNLGDWLIRILPDFLLRETKVGGKFGLRPLVPTNSDGTINTGVIAPDCRLTEAAIIPDSYQLEFSEAASRRPVPMAMLWRQQADDTDVPIVRTTTVADPNAAGPAEQHDLSQFATSENHAVKVGAYLAARRALSTHTATVRLKQGNQSGAITEGDIVQIFLGVASSREPIGVINRFYVVESIGHSLTGEETLSLSHFPVDAAGRSLLALAVDLAVGPGTILPSNRTGGSCDLAGASSDTTVPSKSTSGTPLASQGTGGANGSYSAAGGQSVDLFRGYLGTPSDSPPQPGATSSSPAIPTARGNGAIQPSTDEPLCPHGFDGYAIGSIGWGQQTGPTDATSRTLAFTALSLPMIDPVGTPSNFGAWRVSSWRVTWVGWTGGASGPATEQTADITSLEAIASGYPNFPLDFQAAFTCNLPNGTPGTPQSGRFYTIGQGENMRDVSQKMYGTPNRAQDILDANPQLMGLTLPGSDWILMPGRRLFIPA